MTNGEKEKRVSPSTVHGEREKERRTVSAALSGRKTKTPERYFFHITLPQGHEMEQPVWSTIS